MHLKKNIHYPPPDPVGAHLGACVTKSMDSFLSFSPSELICQRNFLSSVVKKSKKGIEFLPKLKFYHLFIFAT